MTTENWAEERDRLRALLSDLESGKISRFDGGDKDAVKPATKDDHIASIRQRLAALDERLGNNGNS